MPRLFGLRWGEGGIGEPAREHHSIGGSSIFASSLAASANIRMDIIRDS